MSYPGLQLTPLNHILIKYSSDSGTIHAAYGPFSKGRAEWLLTEIADNSAYNWTVIQLRDFQEPST